MSFYLITLRNFTVLYFISQHTISIYVNEMSYFKTKLIVYQNVQKVTTWIGFKNESRNM